MDLKEIEKQAKRIMDDFLKALKEVDEDMDFSIKRDEFTRAEGRANCDEDFRKRFLENAPRKNKEKIIMEKGKWI
ncbi:hypothetical protein HYT58_01495 [Candidatus Woesearchaeota archaeon]|nr:hypothetical protein [Candidatus Woesearchaeota archaeon]